MPREPSGWSLVTLDYECGKCKRVEERVVRNDKRDLQPCTKCGLLMQVQFPIGSQFEYECGPIKPFLDHASPAVKDLGEAWVTTKRQWRDRVRYSERMGFKQGYKGGGQSISKETLIRAEKEARKKK